MKKSLVLAMAMALGVTASAYAANPFSDVPAGHWAYDAVNKLAAAGVVDGYPDGTYGGDKLMTRYEMAQIVAKAMAKGANVDKLAAEFADELDSLGVRVANLEKKADNVKITGQIRYNYVSRDNNADESTLRTRLWVNGQVNEDWTYTAMLQNTQTFFGADDEEYDPGTAGEDEVKMNRAYLDGRVGGIEVHAGRWDEVTFTGNVLDSYIDGVKASYGDKVKVFGLAGKAPSEAYFASSSDRLYVAGVEADLGAVDAYVAYYKANDAGYYDANDDFKVVGDKEIWNIGASYNFAPDFVLSAEYMWGDKDHEYNGEKPGKDGWYADLAWKGASADEPGSYGLHVSYFDQSANAYINPTTDATTFGEDGGYKGWAVGASYAFAKNIVGVVNYYDTEAQTGDADDQVIFSELYFTF
jgi:hypothetical protein